MTEVNVMNAPQLSGLQVAWLQEIGLDRRMLAKWVAKPVPQVSKVAPTVLAGTASKASINPSAVRELPQQDRTVNSAGSQSGIAAARAMLNAGKTSRRSSSAGAVVRSPAPSRSGTPASTTLAAPIPLATPLSYNWEDLETHIQVCQACELHTGRSHVVSGAGQIASPQWMLIGEAPGTQDDRVGLPFQGRAGELLQAMLATISVDENSSVFMTNLIKCRPLGNRTPQPEEISACQPYLQRQIELLQPEKILVLGRLAAQALLGVDTELEQLRGKVHVFPSETGREIPLIVTYHPASLLSRPQHKANAWRDLHLALSVQ